MKSENWTRADLDELERLVTASPTLARWSMQIQARAARLEEERDLARGSRETALAAMVKLERVARAADHFYDELDPAYRDPAGVHGPELELLDALQDVRALLGDAESTLPGAVPDGER